MKKVKGSKNQGLRNFQNVRGHSNTQELLALFSA